jgi:hypothetical protein
MVVLGILVLIYPNLLGIIIGVGLVLVGLYVALQNAQSASTKI